MIPQIYARRAALVIASRLLEGLLTSGPELGSYAYKGQDHQAVEAEILALCRWLRREARRQLRPCAGGRSLCMECGAVLHHADARPCDRCESEDVAVIRPASAGGGR